jgi:cobalt/nickel transport protein
MSNKLTKGNLLFLFCGLGTSLMIAVVVSPFASSNPDGLDRVSQDLKFEHKAAEDTLAQNLPFAKVFDEYALKGVPEKVATPMAGLVGTLATFGLAWGIGKLMIKNSPADDSQISTHQSSEEQVN